MQILKSCILIFFIFISISWLLQVTRLLSLTNLIQVDIITIVLLSLYLLPNLITVVMPFVIIFGIMLCFIKLNRDRELIAIYSLGLRLKTISLPIIIFSLILSIFFILLKFYVSPYVYEKYKKEEFELRNKINFEKMIVSNFLEINNDTVIDFKKNENSFDEILINYKDENENIIFAKKGKISQDKLNYVFELNNGFKLTIVDKEIEKLEFENYLLKINIDKEIQYEHSDQNTFTIFDDIKKENYLNISYKIFDVAILIFIIFFYYNNNIKTHKYNLSNNIFFISLSSLVLITNQLLKNAESSLIYYLSIIISINLLILIIIYYKKLRNE